MKPDLQAIMEFVFREGGGGGVIRLLAEHKGLRDTRHKIKMVLDTRKYIFKSKPWLTFHIWSIMILYCKMRHAVLQNATVILWRYKTKCFCKMCWVFYYKNARISLQNATNLTKCDDLITKVNFLSLMTWYFSVIKFTQQNINKLWFENLYPKSV